MLKKFVRYSIYALLIELIFYRFIAKRTYLFFKAIFNFFLYIAEISVVDLNKFADFYDLNKKKNRISLFFLYSSYADFREKLQSEKILMS